MNAEKDADYDNTCNGEKSPEEKSDSPVPSVLSMKSDKSMKMPIQLKDGECLFDQSALERSHSPDPSVWSLKSDKSMKMPIQLKDGDSVSDQSFEERSHSPDPSVLSLKSDKSMKMPIQLKDGDSVSDQSSEERSHSPDSSVLSLKSDKSMKMPIQLKDGQSVSHQSSLLKSHSPDYSSTQITIHMRDEKNLPHQRHELQIHDREIQQRLKSYIKRKHQYIFEGLEKQGNPTLLNQIYTELYIIEEEAGGISNKHEFTRIEKTFTAAGATIPIKCSDIFRALPGQDKPIRTVLTKGVAGIGKTVSVQKFILDWAEGKENQDVQLIFPLPFREINLIKDKKFSLVSLLQTFLMRETNLHLIQNSSVVFIFDGLDECRLPLNFQSNETLQDVTKETSVDVLLTNLIVGNLLPSALIWITSRPAAADLVPSECVHRVTEVRGFNDPQKEEYFRKRISDRRLANRIISHLKSSRSLFIMCHIPVFCWISAAVLEKMLSRAESGEIPKTLTQMYTHFLTTQINIKDTKYNEKKSKDKEMIFKLGKLAYEQLDRGNLIFYEEDLRECGIDVTEASVYSGLCTQIFREELGLYQGKVFCFVHLTVQEHIAALYVHLSCTNHNRNVFHQIPRQCLCFGVKEWFQLNSPEHVSLSALHQRAVNEALQSKNGHLDLFLQFLLGLSVESHQVLLQGLMKQTRSRSDRNQKTIKYIKKKIRTIDSPEKSINLFYCLNELGDRSLVEEIQQYLRSGRISKANLSSSQWSAVVFVLLTSEKKMDKFDLNKFVGGNNKADNMKVLQKLLPVIKESRSVQLRDCGITGEGCAALASALRSNPSHLRELDLSGNELRDLDIKLLCAALQDSHCKLEKLWLVDCGLTDEGCAALASALRSNPSHLKELDLSWNGLSQSDVKLLSDLKDDPHYKLERLYH